MNSSKFEIQISNSNTHALCNCQALFSQRRKWKTHQTKRKSVGVLLFLCLGWLFGELKIIWSKDKIALIWLPTYLSRLVLFNFILSLCAFKLGWKMKIISLFSLFLLLFMNLTILFGIIHWPTVLFQLISNFIYSTFSNNFSISTK